MAHAHATASFVKGLQITTCCSFPHEQRVTMIEVLNKRQYFPSFSGSIVTCRNRLFLFNVSGTSDNSIQEKNEYRFTRTSAVNMNSVLISIVCSVEFHGWHEPAYCLSSPTSRANDMPLVSNGNASVN